ncbi:hypothetical protein BDQ17DRAFT_1370093 [Cyathus striatus]|nr:hypothetical protein BDQ17DRAFT_1370093 [Cyathus striatus]
MGQISFEKAYLISAYFEGLLYGLLLCLFGVTMYLYFNPNYNKGRQDRHTSVMIGISAIMFFIATFHLAINFYRLLQGYVDTRLTQGSLGSPKAWHNILKDFLFGTQQTLGSAVAIYRTWVLWSYDWKIIVFPIILLMINIISGSLICVAYTVQTSIFSSIVFRRLSWTYESIAFILSVVTVGLMSYRLWSAHRKAINYRVGEGRLLSIMWILMESAALQILTEFLIMVLHISHGDSFHVLLELVTPIVGITFNCITVRVKLQSLKESGMQMQGENSPIQTIGSMPGPLRHVKINITNEVENDLERKGTPESSV